MSQSPKALLFDLDDTLVGTIQTKWAQHKYIAKKFYNKDLTDARIRQHWGKPLTTLILLLYETDNIEQAMSYNIATRNDFPKHLFKETLPTLTALRESGKLIGLVTATTDSSLQNDMDTLGIPRSLFHYIQTEQDTKFHKPDPKVFDPALRWLKEKGIEPNQTLYVGDGLQDMQAALGSGMQFMGVTTGLISQQHFNSLQVPCIEKLTDLGEFLSIPRVIQDSGNAKEAPQFLSGAADAEK